MKKRGSILVTGSSGFVASHLIPELERLGYRVVGTPFRRGGVQLLKRADPEIIIHLAANSEPDRRPEGIRRMMRDNFDRALALFQAAARLKRLRGIVVFGSAGEYELGRMPFTEKLREAPASPYAFSKLCVTHLASYFHRVCGLPVVVVRPSILYGEGQIRDQFIPAVIRKCLKNRPVRMTGGEQAKDLIYVKDLIRALLLILEKLENGKAAGLAGQIINICSGRKITLKEIAERVRKETGSKSVIRAGAIPYRSGENHLFYGSNRKAKHLLGWSPRVSFREGLAKTVRWYREQGK